MPNHTNNLDPKFEEPSAIEIADGVEQAKVKYGIQLSDKDAARYAKLRQELGKWVTADKYYDESQSITDEMAEVVQALLGQSSNRHMSFEEARLRAERSFLTISNQEQGRIVGEIQSIIDHFK